MYTFLCLLLIGAGGGILYFFPYMEHSGKAVVAIVMIAAGLFFLAYRGKSADRVRRDIESINSGNWWNW